MNRRSFAAGALVSLVVVATALVPASTAPAWGTVPSRAVLPSVSINNVSVTEGTGGTRTATFTVTQDKTGKSTITYKTVDGTATSPADYHAATGTVRFAGKKLTRTISITVVSDSLHEDDETFTVVLTKAKGATIADGTGVGTILDDDPPPTVSVPATSSVPEGQTGDISYASVDVTLAVPSGLPASVTWSTADVTATAGSDYTASSGTVTFAPGQTKQAALIPVIGDNASEGDETFSVILSFPADAALGNATDLVTIVDNDPIPPSSAVLSVTGAKVREGKAGTTATLTFTVTRSGETTTAVNVDYATVDGTAGAPTDYASASGTLAFAANQTSASVDVTVNGDAALEHDETFFLNLSNPSAGGAIATGQAIGKIVNDDTRTVVAVKVLAAKHRVAVHGRVSPAMAGKHEVVRLFRLRSGKWVRLATKRPLLSGKTDLNKDGFTDSRYATSFTRAKRGRCKVVATFPGTPRFGSSRAVKLFAC